MFPNYKFFFFKDKWEDLGEISSQEINSNESDPDYRFGYLSHRFCNSIVHIGKENEKLFYFCPRCYVEVEK